MAVRKKKQVSKDIQNLQLTTKVPDDQPVLKLINELAGLMPGVNPKVALKNFLLRKLPAENALLRNNGGQLAGGQG